MTIEEMPPAGASSSLSRWEWLSATVIVVSGALIVWWWSRDAWFYSDFWDFLTRRDLGSARDILAPHNGHWQSPVVVAMRATYAIAGMDYWPVHYVLRALSWAGLGFYSWWLLRRRRGADPIPALGFIGIGTFMAASWYFQSPHFGAPVSIAAVLAAADRVDNIEHPDSRDRAVVLGLLLLAVMSSGPGVAGYGAVAGCLLLTRRLRRWIVPVALVGAIYLAWFTALAVSPGAGGVVRNGFDIVGGVALNLTNMFEELTGFTAWVAIPLLVLTIAGLAWLAWTRRLGRFDLILILWVLLYLGLAARFREGTGRASFAANVTWMFLPLVITRVRPIRIGTKAAVASLFAFLVVSNAVRLHTGLAERFSAVDHARNVVESMALLVSEGQAYGPNIALTPITRSQYLFPDGMLRLMSEGWVPDEVSDRDEAIVRLNVSTLGVASANPVVPAIVAGHYRKKDGCVSGLDGASVTLLVQGPATVSVRSMPPTSLVVGWSSGRSDPAATEIGRIRRQERPLYIYGPPGEGALVTLAPTERVTRVVVCGVRRSE